MALVMAACVVAGISFYAGIRGNLARAGII